MTTMKHLKEIIREDHLLSGGVIFSLVLFIFGMFLYYILFIKDFYSGFTFVAFSSMIFLRLSEEKEVIK